MKERPRLPDFLFFLVFSGTLGLLFLLADGPGAAVRAVVGSGIGIGAMSLWRRRREAHRESSS